MSVSCIAYELPKPSGKGCCHILHNDHHVDVMRGPSPHNGVSHVQLTGRTAYDDVVISVIRKGFAELF